MLSYFWLILQSPDTSLTCPEGDELFLADESTLCVQEPGRIEAVRVRPHPLVPARFHEINFTCPSLQKGAGKFVGPQSVGSL